MYLGAHVSIAESIALAPERGKAVGADAIQIFSRSPRMLRNTKPIPPEEAKAFQEAIPANGIARAIIHANYLINLAGPDENTLNYSRVAFVEELDRAQVLGIRDVIFHPGAHIGKGEGRALKTIAESLDWAFDHAVAPDVAAVLENTAGQGTVVGHSFAQLAEIIKGSSHPERLAVCIDTCDTFAPVTSSGPLKGMRPSSGPWTRPSDFPASARSISTIRKASWRATRTATRTSERGSSGRTPSDSW